MGLTLQQIQGLEQQQAQPQKSSFTLAEIQQMQGGGFEQPPEQSGFIQSVAREVTEPIRRGALTAEAAAQSAVGLGQYTAGRLFRNRGLAERGKQRLGKAQTLQTGTPESYLGVATPYKTPREAVAGGTQLVGLATGKPAIAGGLLAGGKALEEGAGPLETVSKTSLGFGAGLVAGKLTDWAGRALGKLGDKITQTVIKPSQADIKDGFNIATIQKYNLGGSLKKSFNKTETTMDDFTKKLNTALAGSKERINLAEQYTNTVKALSGSKLTGFGSNTARTNALKQLEAEIAELPNGGILSVPEANTVKRAAGHFGAWQYGMRDPESTAREAIYNEFYKQMKVAIEKASPEAKDINKALSELIPVMNAIIRRIPVAARNNVLSLTDVISLVGATFDPSALGVVTATRLGTSGTFGNILSKGARAITPRLSSFAGKVSGAAASRFNRSKARQNTTLQE